MNDRNLVLIEIENLFAHYLNSQSEVLALDAKLRDLSLELAKALEQMRRSDSERVRRSTFYRFSRKASRRRVKQTLDEISAVVDIVGRTTQIILRDVHSSYRREFALVQQALAFSKDQAAQSHALLRKLEPLEQILRHKQIVEK